MSLLEAVLNVCTSVGASGVRCLARDTQRGLVTVEIDGSEKQARDATNWLWQYAPEPWRVDVVAK